MGRLLRRAHLGDARQASERHRLLLLLLLMVVLMLYWCVMLLLLVVLTVVLTVLLIFLLLLLVVLLPVLLPVTPHVRLHFPHMTLHPRVPLHRARQSMLVASCEATYYLKKAGSKTCDVVSNICQAVPPHLRLLVLLLLVVVMLVVLVVQCSGVFAADSRDDMGPAEVA